MHPRERRKQITQALRRAEGVEPLAQLDAVRQARETIEALEVELVRAARAAGTSWSKIGAIYGVSKQGAQQRFRSALAHAESRHGHEADPSAHD